MPITVRTDGILYNDGTLQTTAGGIVPHATSLAKGTVISSLKAAIQATDYNDINGAGIITPYTFESEVNGSLGPGRGQTWYNVTGNRAGGVNYYNATKRGIVVTATGGKTGNYTNIYLYINGILVSTQGGDQEGGWGGGNVNVFAIVPPGQSYMITCTTGIAYWAELRE